MARNTYREGKGGAGLQSLQDLVPVSFLWNRNAYLPTRVAFRKQITLLELIRFKAKADVTIPDCQVRLGFSAKDTVLGGRFLADIPTRSIQYRKKIPLPNGLLLSLDAGIQHVGSPAAQLARSPRGTDPTPLGEAGSGLLTRVGGYLSRRLGNLGGAGQRGAAGGGRARHPGGTGGASPGGSRAAPPRLATAMAALAGGRGGSADSLGGTSPGRHPSHPIASALEHPIDIAGPGAAAPALAKPLGRPPAGPREAGEGSLGARVRSQFRPFVGVQFQLGSRSHGGHVTTIAPDGGLLVRRQVPVPLAWTGMRYPKVYADTTVSVALPRLSNLRLTDPERDTSYRPLPSGWDERVPGRPSSSALRVQVERYDVLVRF